MNMLNIPFPKLNFDDDVILSDILTKELIEQAEKEEKMVVVPIPFSAIENTRNDEDRVMWARGYMYACGVKASPHVFLPVYMGDKTDFLNQLKTGWNDGTYRVVTSLYDRSDLKGSETRGVE